ncbi:hypothetical protein [Dokdonia sp.]|uniref:hypothetical protein n=1 Tax=Dokdonia sp. TaxID=2024995 RepID=UPI003265A79C
MKLLNLKELQLIKGGQGVTFRATDWENTLLRDATSNYRATNWEDVLLRDAAIDS